MALILPVKETHPQFGADCYLAENATITGDVITGDQCSIWFQAVVRGDVNSIRIGNMVNIQDGAIIHGSYEKADTIIGDRVTIGHQAIIHGCKLGNNILVGMGTIIMDNTIVEDNVLIGAGSLVLENKHLESGWLYAGTPARKIKPLDEEHLKNMIESTARHYVMCSGWYKK